METLLRETQTIPKPRRHLILIRDGEILRITPEDRRLVLLLIEGIRRHPQHLILLRCIHHRQRPRCCTRIRTDSLKIDHHLFPFYSPGHIGFPLLTGV